MALPDIFAADVDDDGDGEWVGKGKGSGWYAVQLLEKCCSCCCRNDGGDVAAAVGGRDQLSNGPWLVSDSSPSSDVELSFIELRILLTVLESLDEREGEVVSMIHLLTGV